VKYFKYLSYLKTNDAKCKHEIKSSIAMAKTAFNKKKASLNCKLDFNLKKKLVKYCIWSIALYGVESESR
jgi:hypothetical protein